MQFLANANFSRSQKLHKARTLCTVQQKETDIKAYFLTSIILDAKHAKIVMKNRVFFRLHPKVLLLESCRNMRGCFTYLCNPESTYRGSLFATIFATWKKQCYEKFVQVEFVPVETFQVGNLLYTLLNGRRLFLRDSSTCLGITFTLKCYVTYMFIIRTMQE